MGSYSHQPHFIVIGGGNRGRKFAHQVVTATGGEMGAVCDSNAHLRDFFGRNFIWRQPGQRPCEGQEFSSVAEFVHWELKQREQHPDSSRPDRITGCFIATPDHTHAPIIQELAPLGLHICVEKPLALTLNECLGVQEALNRYPAKVFSIGHILRYTYHNELLYKLIHHDKVLGDVHSVEHTEPIGWKHFSQSYVRGSWRRPIHGSGTLLSKCSHDMDFIMWIMSSPSPLTGKEPHLPSTVASHGALTHFRKNKKPKAAGNATNCYSCPAESTCLYSARSYAEDKAKNGEFDWPMKVIVPDIEETIEQNGWEEAASRLRKNILEDYDDKTAEPEVSRRPWWGRCVFECDNDVVDEQTVLIDWEDEGEVGRGPKHCVFHLTYAARQPSERRGRIYGSAGELSYDGDEIIVHTFADNGTKTYNTTKGQQARFAGGDEGLTKAFVRACQEVDSGCMTVEQAQRDIIGFDLAEAIRSHAIIFAAEESRRSKTMITLDECMGSGPADSGYASPTSLPTSCIASPSASCSSVSPPMSPPITPTSVKQPAPVSNGLHPLQKQITTPSWLHPLQHASPNMPYSLAARTPDCYERQEYLTGW